MKHLGDITKINGAEIQWEKSATLGVSQDQTLFVWKETDLDLPTKVTDTE